MKATLSLGLLCGALLWAASAAAEPILVVPWGEPMDAWREAAADLGFVLGEAPAEGPWVSLRVDGDRWVLRADDGAGRVREQVVAVPADQLGREELLLLAGTMLQPAPEAAEGVAAGIVEPTPEPAAPAVAAAGDPDPEPRAFAPGAGAWLGGAVRADLRAGRRQATSIGVRGGVEFGPGLRVGGGIEGTTGARLDQPIDDGPVRSTWSLGGGGGIWWALPRPVAPILGVELGVQTRSFVADLGVETRVAVPVVAFEVGAAFALGRVLRLEPQVRLAADLRPTGVELEAGATPSPLSVQFGVGLTALSGRPDRGSGTE